MGKEAKASVKKAGEAACPLVIVLPADPGKTRLARCRSGLVPDECSREIPEAPARGPVDPFREVRVMPTADGYQVTEVPYRAGCAARVRDVFDVMTEQAARRGGPAPFTLHEVAAARDYRALTERLESAGLRSSMAFATTAGGTGYRDFMDAYLSDSRRLAAFHAAIGLGLAKDVRRRVPAMVEGQEVGATTVRAMARRPIPVRALVDAVCLADKPVSAVLKAHAWRDTGKNILALRHALRAALERMQGV